MKKYYLLCMMLVITGCISEPEPVALEPELNYYDGIQKGCVRLAKDESPIFDKVKEECISYRPALEIANKTYIDKKKHKNDSLNFRTRSTYKAAKKQLDKQYKHFNLILKSIAFDAIDKDDVNTFTKIINFSTHKMNIYYYNYMSRYPRLKDRKKYIKFKNSYALKKYNNGYKLVNRGKYTKGLADLSIASSMGNVKASKLCGDVYYDLFPSKSLTCYKQAVKNGDNRSYYNVGRLYEEEEDYKNSYKWYKKSAKVGNYISEYKLFTFYRDGKGVLVNNKNSKKWLKVSAENGYQKAQKDYGLYLVDKGQTDKAIKYLQAAADKGEALAFYPLGKIYLSQKRYKKAYWALSHGNISADSLYKLGYLKEYGKGTERNFHSANIFYVKASKMGKKNINKDIRRTKKAQQHLKKRQINKERSVAKENIQEIKNNRKRMALASQEDTRLRKEREKRKSDAIHLKAQACGEEPSSSTLRKNGKRIHLEGKVTQWLGKKAFLIKVNGDIYYIKDEDDDARVNKGDRVNIVAISTGKRTVVSGLRKSIFELSKDEAMAKGYSLVYDGICPY